MLCPEGIILPEHLPVRLGQKSPAYLRGSSKGRDGSPGRDQEALLQALKEAGGKMSEAARILGVSRVTLWKWLKHHKISAKDVL